MSTVTTNVEATSLLGNGGRKLIRLTNGTLIAFVKYSTGINRYKSTDNGATWTTMAGSFGAGGSISGFSAVALESNRYAILWTPNGTTVYFNTVESNDTINTVKSIDVSQTAIGNVSLAIDPSNGTLHAAWSSKNASYPNTFNIRYAKSTDGGVTWSAVEQVTTNNTSGVDCKNPSIIIRADGKPLCAFEVDDGSNNRIMVRVGDNLFTGYIVFNNASYAQSSPSAVVDKDGVSAAVWHGYDSANPSTYYIRFSKSTDGGTSWSAMQKLVPGINGTFTVDKTGKYFITYEDAGVIKRIESTDKGANWSTPTTVGTGTNPSSLFDPMFAGQFGTAPSTIYKTASSVEYTGSYTTNNAPTVTLNTTDNQTLYENSTYTIAGQALDTDNGNVVNVKYSIDGIVTKALVAGVSNGVTPLAFNKQLTFKNGKLFDGETSLTGDLAEGTAHQLKVWAEDDQGGKSADQIRSFYVVPNRAPSLTINTPQPSGTINSDKFTISGTCSDIDGNDVVVTYRINSGLSTEIYRGAGADFAFDVSLGELIVGSNAIVVEVADTYGFKTSKTVKLAKSEIKSALLSSTARYQVLPPKGSAKGIVLWVQHQTELNVEASISAVLAGEQEQFVAMTKTNTAPVDVATVEDEFTFESSDAKEDITIKLDLKRTTADVSDAITLITGVLS